MKNKENGGLGLPNLKHYYWSTHLRTISAWVINDPEILWVSIEQNSIPGLPLCNLPFLNPASLKKVKIVNPWILHTLKIWNLIQKQTRGTSGLSRAMPIVSNIEFLPSMSDGGFKRWADKELIIINHLLCGQTFKSFSQLKEEFSLLQKDLYRYLQIRDYVTKHALWELVKREPTNIEEYFIKLFEKQTKAKKAISILYRNLMQNQLDNTFHIKYQWEIEMNVIITDEVWEKMCSCCHKGINSQDWREFDWKTKMRFFQTPLKTYNIKSTPTDKCWRNCGKVGDHTHIFWDCPKIAMYWEDIKKIIEDLLKIDIPRDPLLFVLDQYPNDLLTNDQSYMLHYLLMVARKIITINWLKPQSPTVAQWTQKLQHIYTMECLTAQLQFKMDVFLRRWSHVTNLFN